MKLPRIESHYLEAFQRADEAGELVWVDVDPPGGACIAEGDDEDGPHLYRLENGELWVAEAHPDGAGFCARGLKVEQGEVVAP